MWLDKFSFGNSKEIFRRNYEAKHRRKIANTLRRIPDSKTLDGWDLCVERAVGGLLYVSFSEYQPGKLLILSSQGIGILDCDHDQLVYFYEENNCDIDEYRLLFDGVDCLQGEVLRLSGIGGGGLPLVSRYGGSIEKESMAYPKEALIFQPQSCSCFMNPERCCRFFSDYGFRAYGFSECGRYLLVATSGDVYVWRKKEMGV